MLAFPDISVAPVRVTPLAVTVPANVAESSDESIVKIACDVCATSGLKVVSGL